jgi:hypothetical protein
LAAFYGADPAGQGLGAYSYVGNNPIMKIDPPVKIAFLPLIMTITEIASATYTAYNFYKGLARLEGVLSALGGAAFGAVIGGLSNAITNGLMQNVNGILPGMAVGAGVKGSFSGLQSVIMKDNFWNGF